MRMLVLMLLTFKKVKLIFGHPVFGPCTLFMRKFCKNTTGNPDFYLSHLPRWPRSQELKNLRALVYGVPTPCFNPSSHFFQACQKMKLPVKMTGMMGPS